LRKESKLSETTHKGRKKMNRYRKTAIIAGVFFITATAASILSLPFLASMNAPTYLVAISSNANQFLLGIFLSFLAAFASVSIAMAMYPVLRKQNESLALGAVGFRLIEGVFYLGGAITLLVLLSLSREFVKTGTSASFNYNIVGIALLNGYRFAGNVGAVLAFCIGASLYYLLFYQTKLVPRWLSVWGLLGAALLMVAILMVMFQMIEPLSTPQVLLALPIALQEMVLAIWLIVRGFNSSAIASLSAKTEGTEMAVMGTSTQGAST
jgi:Domain of unknown function (DUF4386)